MSGATDRGPEDGSAVPELAWLEQELADALREPEYLASLPAEELEALIDRFNASPRAAALEERATQICQSVMSAIGRR